MFEGSTIHLHTCTHNTHVLHADSHTLAHARARTHTNARRGAYPTSEFTVKTATVIQPSVVLPIVYNDNVYGALLVGLMGLTR